MRSKYEERNVIINYYNTTDMRKGYERGKEQLNNILNKGWKVKTATPMSDKHLISYIVYKK